MRFTRCAVVVIRSKRRVSHETDIRSVSTIIYINVSGPCRGLVSPEDYGKYITRVRQILNGETVELENVLKDEMSRLSEEWKFEEAQVVKEKYEAVRKYNAKSVIGEASESSADMFAYVENEDRAFVNFMHLNRER